MAVLKHHVSKGTESRIQCSTTKQRNARERRITYNSRMQLSHILKMGKTNWDKEAEKFETLLKQIKSEHELEGFTWYAYGSMSNLQHLQSLLGKDVESIFKRNHDLPMMDIGAADGDMAFFLESQGFDIDILDYPPTNWNHLRGAKRLKELLESNVGIHELDLDSYFEIPRQKFGLILFLGILYHLKNPYFVLELFARHAREIILSTRIARFHKQNPKAPVDGVPCSYLLAANECNNDATNYWVFSKAGLQRLLERTGWQVERFVTVGDTKRSNPSDADHDERAFVLAKSTVFSG